MKKRAPMDFDLRQLEVFQKVVELGSFSKAAEAVFLAQASVSERISNLEGAVGARLLDRLGRKVVPTKAGELLYKHAVLLLDMKKNATMEMQQFLGTTRGEILIGASTIPGEYILPKLLDSFFEQYPLIRINLTVRDSGVIQEKVLSGELEIGLIGFQTADRNLICRPLWRDELVLAVPAAHRLAKRSRIEVDELSQEAFISREQGSGTLMTIEDHLKMAPGEKTILNAGVCLGTSTAVKEGIKSGLGISILSYRAIETEIEAGALCAVRFKGLPMERKFYLIRDRRRIPSPICSALDEYLQSTADKSV